MAALVLDSANFALDPIWDLTEVVRRGQILTRR